MEVPASGFWSDFLLRLRAPGARLSGARAPEISPGGCPPTRPAPGREPGPRLRCALPPGLLQPRAASSSFLIRDILADCLPDPDLVYSDPGQPELESTRSGPEEDFQDLSVSGSDSETRVGGASERLKKNRKARTAFSDKQLARLERSFQKQKTKWKRQSAGLELLAEAGRMFLPTHFLFPQTRPTPDLYLYQSPPSRHPVLLP
ncbi:BarH-like 1 homeobox protein [Liparis tanakae]|uniref:BarH-like 1 homeobox protein n=1 Tax=Liparis tanakae TaxID=230148 RepID=A0A4Z2GRB8_9TELE|nr:BarH-like 1 homeobox protein [Liparis tanakae]